MYNYVQKRNTIIYDSQVWHVAKAGEKFCYSPVWHEVKTGEKGVLTSSMESTWDSIIP